MGGAAHSGPMAGFLRRLRRPKDADSEEGPAEATEEPDPEPTEGGDIYQAGDLPPRDEISPEEEPVLATGPIDSEPLEPESVAPYRPSESEPIPSPPVPEFAGPSALPPPLPQADRNAARSSIAPRRTGSTCFLCGSEMDGPWCPSCRMAWAE